MAGTVTNGNGIMDYLIEIYHYHRVLYCTDCTVLTVLYISFVHRLSVTKL